MNEYRQHSGATALRAKLGQARIPVLGAICGLAGVLLLATGLQAAAEEGPVDGPEQEEQESQEAARTPTDRAAPPPEVFLPTEEISEDYAAPFPVDI